MYDSYVSDLRSTVSRLQKLMRKQSETINALNMTELETFVLILRNPGILSSELATRLAITNQSMSQILNKFETMGAITRTVSETDKRKMHIELTEGGIQLVETTRKERDQWLLQRIKERLTGNEIEELKELLPLLQKLLDDDSN